MAIPEKYQKLWTLAGIEFEKYSTLPMAVYVTAADGTFLDYNLEAEHLLYLEAGAKGHVSVLDFYINKVERKRIIEKLSQKSSGEWEKNQTLEFFIQGQKHSLRFFAKPFFDEFQQYIGCIALVFTITELERFRELEDVIPIGIFEINSDEKIAYANKKFRKIFNISEKQINEIKAEDFFINRNDYLKIKEELIQTKDITVLDPVKLKINDSSHIFGKLKIIPEFDGDILVKSKGIIDDVTFNNLMNLAPIGLYLVMKNELKEDIVVRCNRHFAEIKGFHHEREIEGRKIIDFHQDKFSYDDFISKLEDACKKGTILTDHFLRIKTVGGKSKEVIVHAKALLDDAGNIEGRVGAVYEVTDNISKKLTAKTQNDFASLLHSYSAMINNVKSTLQAVVTGHDDPDILEGDKVNIQGALKKIFDSLERLKKFLNNYYKLGLERNLINEIIIKKIARQIAYIDNQNESESKERVAFVRRVVKNIRNILRKESNFQTIPRELRKSIFNELTEILRYSRVISLSITIQEVKDNLYEIEAYKEALITNDNENVQYEVLDVSEILEEVVYRLDEFAQARDLSLKIHYRTNDVHSIEGIKREISIAFYNLIHNAIKYSWRKVNENSYVLISIEKEKKSLKISIQNRGVPIRKEELENGDVYNFGFRGASSGDRDRKGLGIGLWHSRKIVESHKGKLYLTSEPLLGNIQDDYTKPFITTAFVLF